MLNLTETAIAVGDVVTIAASCRYGVVNDVLPRHNQSSGVSIHKIDPDTGRLMACPDDRCRGHDRHCPIHQSWFYTHEDYCVFSEADLRFYNEEGMLADDLLETALANIAARKRKPRRAQWPL